MPPNNNPYYSSGTPNPSQGNPGSIPSPVFPQQAPQRGANDRGKKSIGLILAFIVTLLLLFGAAGFGYWAFMERQDYKNNVDQKVAAAVEVAVKETTDENNLRYAEESKNPLKSYTGPAQYGSIKLQYPKTWSAYVDLTNTSMPLQLTLHPDVVPAVRMQEGRQAIALKIEIRNQTFDQVVSQRQSFVDRGEIKATAYALPKVPNEAGLKFTGKINQQFNGTEIVIPVRDKTLVITTETDQFLSDFEKHIIPNLSFEP